MKCFVCGEEVVHTSPAGAYPPGTHGLTITTNEPCEAVDFKVMFGVWDHRRKERLEICGACLCDKLRKGAPQ